LIGGQDMETDIRKAKRELRRAAGESVRQLSAAERAVASVKAMALLEKQPLWRQAESILFYAPMTGELDVWPMLEAALAAGKTAGLPRFDGDAQCYVACRIRDLASDVEMGRFGIREPVAQCAGDALKRLDLILVPGVAFDLHGRRLGRGKGYYDHLLAAVSGTACAVAFDEQIVDAVPVESHDVVLNCILTPTRWIEL